ncbi:molybdenum cofactor guanylyltransferase [Halalkalicoccus jeotgali]|uniref:Probable molybdenum cofactor guanylyltransferase n=1 Tax=Halalkalicoccus jeotgali (strain DSM 18796 / CECT 7217 / JCM 14584 / KCTC 4019 / B3) TaxID=795797 RepID=D8J2W3_HALJB|nr:molybdenum cofactor guanylyltransferase [Halalkalicoccus jeotgali]ADJ15070.1 molybdopterin-guanine dinucleotide biosynthesis protein A [Halalkalicoccus jeotgali B3]ELY34911.1 molybdopterin-guanine dinucleotide biosynthesis protein A [Halalkalicoccus jeotgali B3]
MPDGVVLAGGRSTRFGETDKATADLGGTPMIRRVGDRLEGATDRLVVNCRADQTAAIKAAFEGYSNPLVVAEDPDPDEGPMAGIRTGLRDTESEYAFVAACDMPFVEPALVAHLFERAHGYDAAVPRVGDGWFQPTHAVYRTESMVEACERALAAGERKVIAPLEYLEYVVIGESEVLEYALLKTFENLNTREEFEEALKRLE